MNFNEWWESITEPERKMIGRTNAKYVWVCAQEAEREEIAKMFEGAPPLVEFAQNDKGGCMVCGFTPKHAASAIRARSNP